MSTSLLADSSLHLVQMQMRFLKLNEAALKTTGRESSVRFPSFCKELPQMSVPEMDYWAEAIDGDI